MGCSRLGYRVSLEEFMGSMDMCLKILIINDVSPVDSGMVCLPGAQVQVPSWVSRDKLSAVSHLILLCLCNGWVSV